MKSTLVASLLGLSICSSAWAQTTPPTTSTPSTPPSASTTATPSTAPTAVPQWHQKVAGEMRASKLIGTTVRNSANENIGEVNDVLLDASGKVTAVVVGVGGFLGIGEHLVAMDFNGVKLMQDGGTTVATVNATKEGLKAAPQWTWTSDNTGVTGTGTSPTGTSTQVPKQTR